MLVIAFTLLKKKQTFLDRPIISEVKIHSTAKKLIKGLTSEPLAPLLDILVTWHDKPISNRETVNNLFESMYREIPSSRQSIS